MKPGRNFLIGAVSALAISALPYNLDSISLGSFEPSSALAKGGNGGGNGKGGGNGGSGHGKSGEARGHGKSGGARVGPRSPRLFEASFSKETHGAKRRASSDLKTAKSMKSSWKQVAALPDTVLVPETKPKNLHARLAGLNSLNRNYHAYLNSQSPRFASIFDYVMDSALGVVDIDDQALREALLDAANQNRVAQYGDDYLNDDVMDWARDVLGVGDDFGKIDEVRETLEIDDQ